MESDDAPAMTWRINGGSVTGLTLRLTEAAPDRVSPVIEILGAQPTIRDSDVSAHVEHVVSAILITGPEAASRIIGNQIRGTYLGISGAGGATIEGKDISDATTGLRFSDGSPSVRDNLFRRVSNGFLVTGRGGGDLPGNTFAQCSSGISLPDGAVPRVENNRFSECETDIFRK